MGLLRAVGVVALVLVLANAVAAQQNLPELKESAHPVLELEKDKNGMESGIGLSVQGEQDDDHLLLDELVPSVSPKLEETTQALVDTSNVIAREIPVDALERFRNDPDYQYESVHNTGPSLLERFLRWFSDTFLQPVAENTSESFWFWFWVLLAIVSIGWAISRILSSDSSGFFRRRDNVEAPDEMVLLDVEDIKEINVAALLEKALADGRYRDAARFMYLVALQSLTKQGVIDWDKHKTNREYVLEVRKNGVPGLAPSFSEVTRLFEWIWYGEATVDHDTFPFVRTQFDAFEQKLRSNSRRAQ